MTRTPRNPRNPRIDLRSLSARVSDTVSRKTLVYMGAGLALAGAGASVASGFATTSAAAAGTDSVGRAAAVAAAKHHPAHSAHAAPHAKPAPAKKAPAKKAPAKHAPAKHAAAKHAKHAQTWTAVRRIVADKTFPKAGHGALPPRDQLRPVALSGPQTWMPITTARYENAKAIVRQAIDKHMGLRAAVIAVATAMQESTLENINYGDRDSLGLFQQRPSCGWGSASQILRPAYAADAFLGALHGYEARDPGWAHQPLWESAQGVQASGFPTAYAKWEAQAAHLVATIAPRLV